MKFIKKITYALLVLFFLITNIRFFAYADIYRGNETAVIQQTENHGQKYVEGEVLVKYKNNKINLDTASGKNKSLNFARSNSLTQENNLIDENISVLKITDNKSVEEKIAELSNDPNVESVQPNFLYSPTTDSWNIGTNDTYVANLWNLANISAPQAWAINEGTTDLAHPVIVAVIDNGVDYNHPDLAANMWDGTNCKDENGNALGDCSHGYDYYDNDKTPLPILFCGGWFGTDCVYEHGTHLAGTIAAVKNNGIGVAGVAPNAKIMAIRVGAYSFPTYIIIKAINFAKQNGAKIINASFGYACNIDTNCYDSALQNAIGSFPGIVVIASGNYTRNNDGGVIHEYPADFTDANIISTAATDVNGVLAGFSNYGAISVDVGAPGVNIFSTEPDVTYDYMSGTSMATSNTSGLVALIEGYNPNLTTSQVKSIILSTGDSLPSLAGKTVTGKKINAESALVASNPNTQKFITAFNFATPETIGVIDDYLNTISLTVPFGTNVATLTPTITTTGVSVSPASGTPQDFSSPVVYTVTATDSTTRNYTVTVNVLPNPDIAFVDADMNALTNNSIKGANSGLSNITTSLAVLPSTGSNGSTITWASSNTAVVSNNGQTVIRPTFGSGNATVTLTATITKGAVTNTKVFTLIVIELPNPDIAFVDADKTALVDSLIYGANSGLSNITTSLAVLPSTGSNGSTITWASSNTAVVSIDGQTIVRPTFGLGNATVTLTATITKGDVTDTKVFTLIVIEIPNPDIAFVAADKTALTIGLGTNPDLANITTPLVLPSTGSNGSIIQWISSSDSSVISQDGLIVNRPVFGAGNATVILTAAIIKGDVSDTKAFTLIVIKLPNSAKNITVFIFGGLSPTVNGNISGTNISLTVPFATVVTALSPTITTTGVSVNPASGVPQNFSYPIVYTITAADNTTKNYTVTVVVSSSSNLTALNDAIISAQSKINNTAVGNQPLECPSSAKTNLQIAINNASAITGASTQSEVNAATDTLNSALEIFELSIKPDPNKSAYSENLGWINFNSTEGNVVVTDSALTGYAYSQNAGWISLNCSNTNGCSTANYKVANDGNGNLSGYAYGENIGWINFNPAYGGVAIDSSGNFSGLAYGQNTGWISFNCSDTTSCASNGGHDYKVTTTWRIVAQTLPVVTSGGSSGGSPAPAPAPFPISTTVITPQARTQIISYIANSLKGLSLSLTQQGSTPAVTTVKIQIIQSLLQALMQLLKLVS